MQAFMTEVHFPIKFVLSSQDFIKKKLSGFLKLVSYQTLTSNFSEIIRNLNLLKSQILGNKKNLINGIGLYICRLL